MVEVPKRKAVRAAVVQAVQNKTPPAQTTPAALAVLRTPTLVVLARRAAVLPSEQRASSFRTLAGRVVAAVRVKGQVPASRAAMVDQAAAEAVGAGQVPVRVERAVMVETGK
jgi:hypothetical protein